MKQRGMNQRGMNRRLGKKMRGGAEEVAVPKKKVDKAKIKESAERARSFLKDQFQWGKLYSYMSNLIIPTLILLFILINFLLCLLLGLKLKCIEN